MIKKQFLFGFFFFFVLTTIAQKIKRGFLYPKKIGALYNMSQEDNFLFDDLDYSYSTSTFKIQAFYTLGSWKGSHFEMIIQPQIQVVKHQLLNEQFVLPSEANYQQKRAEFTKLKTMHLYAFELGFSIKREILTNTYLHATIGLGVATIDTRTERLAKGFTFIENGSLGLSYKTSEKTFLYIGSTVGHVSNFDTQSPNSGYNLFGFEMGVQYLLN